MTTKIYRTAAKLDEDKQLVLSVTGRGEDGAILMWSKKTRAEAEEVINRRDGWFLVEVLWDEDNEKVVPKKEDE